METPIAQVEELWANSIAPEASFPPEARLSPIQDGYSTEVYQVSLEGQSRVLRIYPTSSKPRLTGYLQANQVLSRFGMRVPKIERWGMANDTSWVLEEHIIGVGYRNLLEDVDAIGKASETLAALHSHTRNRYGEVGGWGGFRLTLRWRQRFSERWRKVTRLYPELGSVTDRVLAWYRDWSESYSPQVYQLLHNDFHPGNLILTEEGDVALLDLRSPRYGLGLMELIEASHYFRGEEPSEWSLFLCPYMRCMPSGIEDSYEKYSEGCHAIFHLRQTDRFANLALGRRGTFLNRRIWEENALDSWKRFCKITGVVSPNLDLPHRSAFKEAN